MKIKELKCKRFGGISDLNVKFTDGLNVIVGANETGKSTLMEGLLAVFFRSHRLKKNMKADKEFLERFLPYPTRDFASVQVSFAAGGEDYEIAREWGADPSSSLSVSGEILKDENLINAKLKGILKYGENTYRNIVFASQKEMKETLERIGRDTETSESVGNILRQAVMALDGISVEKMKKTLEDKIRDYQGKWDLENNRPEGGRGLDDRWKKGVGKVLESYYEKESIKRRMEHARNIEEQYFAAGEKLKEIKEKLKFTKDEFAKYNQIENDIVKRASLEAQLEMLEKEGQVLREVSKQFPVNEDKLRSKKETLEGLRKREEKLKEELEQAKKVKEANDAKDLIDKVEVKERELRDKRKEKNKLVEIKDSDVKRLEELNDIILTAKASMEAATLLGRLNRSKGSRVFVTRGLEQKEEIGEGEEFSASGYLKVEVGSEVELEIRAGHINFEDLKKQYTEAKNEFNQLLSKLQVADLAEAKVNNRIYGQLQKEIEMLDEQIAELLGDKTKDELNSIVEEAKKLTSRSFEEINKELDKLKQEILEISNEVSVLDNIVSEWKSKYESPEKAIEMLAGTLNSINDIKKSLGQLAELPEEFGTAQEFQDRMQELRDSANALEQEEQAQRDAFYNIQKQLPDTSYEELVPLYKEAENEFQRRLSFLQALVRINEVFQDKLNEMDKESFRPLADAFSEYISLLTLDKYETGSISDNLEVGLIRKKDNVMLPVQLFSAGTYDCVLLALRLALLDYLFEGDGGFVVLDDCLVNLDPERREKAAELLRRFAEKKQVIFTTCDPGTAALLGGKVINI